MSCSTLDVVIVGAGRMGHEHAAAVRVAGDRFLAFLDRSPGSAEFAAVEHGATAFVVNGDLVPTLEQLAGRGASAVVVASPSALHLGHAGAALRLGLPV